jgi:hypothetical protein
MTPTLKLGRRPTPLDVRDRQVRLRAYLPAELPAPPVSADFTAGVTSWPMMLNDRLGDCTAAGAAHLLEVWTTEVDGSPRVVSDDDVLRFYELQGYVPGDPSTDQGADMVSVLTAWRDTGLAGDQVLGWAAVHSSQADLETACWLFSGLYCGLNVPQSAIDQFHAGAPWTVVRDDGGIVGGHCVPIVAYDAQGVTVVTWGALHRATWEFVRAYFDEFYAVVPSDDERLAGRALPNGLALDQLIADIDSIGGNVPAPAPGPQPAPPSPTPPPAPVPPPAPPQGFEDWLEREAERLPEPIRDWIEAVLAHIKEAA